MIIKKTGIENYIGIGKKAALGLLLLVVLTSGCMKAKQLPGPLTETGPLEEESQERQDQESKKDVSDGRKSRQKADKDLDMDALIRRFQKAIRSLQQGKIEKAQTLFEALRDQYPAVSVFHHNLGIVYKRSGQIDAAIKAYEQALGLNPDGGSPSTYYNLAIAYREKGAFKKAENAYRVAIALAPDFEDAHFNLAVLYDLYLDDPEKALEHYQQQIELSDETNKEIEIWMSALKKRLAARRH